jgi:hypothetical protein
LLGTESGAGRWIAVLNPYRALGELLNPLARHPDVAHPTVTAIEPVAALSVLAALLVVAATQRVRVWNPSRSIYEQVREKAARSGETRSRHRPIWSNPVIWREICTRAYGRKIFVIKLAYFVLAGFLALWAFRGAEASLVLGMIPRGGAAFVMLTLVGLLLVTAQAVTSLTSERDGQTLELLLVTDVTAREFIFGKLGGVFYNTKEVLLVPLAFLVAFAARGDLGLENFVYLLLGLATLAWFCAMLGLHSALSYDISRKAILHSLGTVFFLFVGTFICLMMIVEARASYELQAAPFAVFILGGGLGLWSSLGRRNPSTALFMAAMLLPFLTFYSAVGFLQGDTASVCAAVVFSYGFTVIAMLIPAISEFDYALGRTTLEHG